MKNKKKYVNDRRNNILKFINENKKASVEKLSEFFNVSAITIRRDLQYLEDNNKLIRFYGGAKAKENVIIDSVSEREICKQQLAKYAASLINDGDTIFINSSSTSIKILDFIDKKNVTVITNNIKAVNVELKNNMNVIITGGEIRYPKEILLGDYAIKTLQNIYAKKSFIGCSGISLECGMTTSNANEVNINKLMIEHTTVDTYFIADYTKICKNSSFITCNSSNIKNLITDDKVPEKILDLFRKNGTKVHIVKINYE